MDTKQYKQHPRPDFAESGTVSFPVAPSPSHPFEDARGMHPLYTTPAFASINGDREQAHLPTIEMPVPPFPSSPGFISCDDREQADLPTIKVPVTPFPLPREPESEDRAQADLSTIKVPMTPASPVLARLSLPAISKDTRSHTSLKAFRPLSSLSPEEQMQAFPGLSMSQKMQAVTVKVQAISQKIQAVWSQWPFHVEHLKVMNKQQERSYKLLVALWIVANLYFWLWWLQGSHIGNPVLYGLMCLSLLYEGTLLPSFYTFYLGNMRQPKSMDADIARKTRVVKKVAVMSLTVPGSEDVEIVRQQLLAMTRIRYPHDSWILVDKEHSPTIQQMAQSLGVHYFSRHDVERWGEEKVKYWNQPVPPFKAKTKAGNVNSWIDAYGDAYSHFTQLDIDHKPVPEYLHKVLGYFLDPKVKWVQAPSVYGNVDTWTARGSAEQEFVLQGPLQMGFYGFCQTPFIIGSHCTYDMAAIRAIGGFQPTRAEDHLDTVFLAAQGHQGVFLPDVIAVGDGPENFDTYLAQQFAWAFSMIQVLLNFTPKAMKHYTPRQALQFLFVQTWYVLWSLTMFLLFLLPILSLFLNAPIARVSYWEFLLLPRRLSSTTIDRRRNRL